MPSRSCIFLAVSPLTKFSRPNFSLGRKMLKRYALSLYFSESTCKSVYLVYKMTIKSIFISFFVVVIGNLRINLPRLHHCLCNHGIPCLQSWTGSENIAIRARSSKSWLLYLNSLFSGTVSLWWTFLYFIFHDRNADLLGDSFFDVEVDVVGVRFVELLLPVGLQIQSVDQEHDRISWKWTDILTPFWFF